MSKQTKRVWKNSNYDSTAAAASSNDDKDFEKPAGGKKPRFYSGYYVMTSKENQFNNRQNMWSVLLYGPHNAVRALLDSGKLTSQAKHVFYIQEDEGAAGETKQHTHLLLEWNENNKGKLWNHCRSVISKWNKNLEWTGATEDLTFKTQKVNAPTWYLAYLWNKRENTTTAQHGFLTKQGQVNATHTTAINLTDELLARSKHRAASRQQKLRKANTVEHCKELMDKYDIQSMTQLTNMNEEDFLAYTSYPNGASIMQSLLQYKASNTEHRNYLELLEDYLEHFPNVHEYDTHYSCEQGLYWIERILEMQQINFEDFANACINVVDMRCVKQNSLYLWGVSNSGKSTLARVFFRWLNCGDVAGTGQFSFQDLIGKRLGLCEEVYITPDNVETMKLIMEGLTTTIQVKNKPPTKLVRTPLVFTSNTPLWMHVSSQETILRNRIYRVFKFNNCFDPAAAGNKEMTKQIHPISAQAFLQKYGNRELVMESKGLNPNQDDGNDPAIDETTCGLPPQWQQPNNSDYEGNTLYCYENLSSASESEYTYNAYTDQTTQSLLHAHSSMVLDTLI